MYSNSFVSWSLVTKAISQRCLTVSKKDYRVVNVYGSLGIGKTATLVAVGKSAKEYGFRVAYADLQGKVTIPAWYIYEQILASLGTQSNPLNPHHFETILRQTGYQNTSIILDNIDKTDVLSMEGFIELISFFPRPSFKLHQYFDNFLKQTCYLPVMNVNLERLPVKHCVKGYCTP